MPTTATLAELHEVIQVAMGWEQHHLHVFGRGDLEYGDNARDETSVTLASLIGRAGDWLGYRYDFGDCWDNDIEVEKVHQAAKKATYPRCSAGGRACPPEDSGGPEGYIEPGGHAKTARHHRHACIGHPISRLVLGRDLEQHPAQPGGAAEHPEGIYALCPPGSWMRRRRSPPLVPSSSEAGAERV